MADPNVPAGYTLKPAVPQGYTLKPTAPAKAEEPQGFWGGIGEGLTGLVTGARDLGQLAAESVDSPLGRYGGEPGAAADLIWKIGRGMHDAAAEQFAKAGENFHSGSYLAGLRHG